MTAPDLANISDIPLADSPDDPSSSTPRADLVAAELCLDAALPDGLIGALARHRPIAVAITVPSEAWCDPVQDRIVALVLAARRKIAASPVRPRLVDPALIVRRGNPTPKQRREDQSQAAEALAIGHGLVGIGV